MKNLMLILAMLMAASTAWAQQARTYEKDTCNVITKINPQEKVIYLVFTGHFGVADGGHFENFDGIEPVLNTLKRKGVKAAFFPTAITLEQKKYEKSVQRIINEGHYLSAHSYAHLLLCDTNGKSLVTRDSVLADLHLMEKQLERFGLSKKDYNWMIPPYETCNIETAGYYLNEGYTLLNPTRGLINDQDWTSPGKDNYKSLQMILDHLWNYEAEHTLNGFIVLIHAMNYPDRTPEDRPYNYLGQIIDYLTAKGYRFEKVRD